MTQDYKSRFFELALRKGNLGFGRFTLKSGRVSPYFFNAGGFDDGASLAQLADCYAYPNYPLLDIPPIRPCKNLGQTKCSWVSGRSVLQVD